MVPSWADQLLPQFLMEQFDTLSIQCWHIEHMHGGVWFRKNNFLQNDSCGNLDNFPLTRLLYMHIWCLHGPINSYHSFRWSSLILAYSIKTHWTYAWMSLVQKKQFLTKWQLWEYRQFFHNKAFVYAKMVPSWADQLLPQLYMEQFDTLPI